MNNQQLIIDQVEHKLSPLKELNSFIMPEQGWIKSIRLALKMNLRQLGKRLGITSQSIKEIEEREKNGSLTINGLKKFSEAMNMKFVYGFIPEQESIEAMIEKRALEVAQEIVMRTAQSMELEAQGLTQEQLEKAIRQKQAELVKEMPKYLWE